MQHAMTADGESTEKWAMREPGFMGSIRQLTDCARCGCTVPGGKHKPMHWFDMLKPTKHMVCDPCFDQLPE